MGDDSGQASLGVTPLLALRSSEYRPLRLNTEATFALPEVGAMDKEGSEQVHPQPRFTAPQLAPMALGSPAGSFATTALIIIKISQFCIASSCIVSALIALSYPKAPSRYRFQLILCAVSSVPLLMYYKELISVQLSKKWQTNTLNLQITRYSSWIVVSGVLSVLLVLFRGPFDNESKMVVGMSYESWIVAAPIMSAASTLSSSLFSFCIRKTLLHRHAGMRLLFLACGVFFLVVCMTSGSLFNYCVYERTKYGPEESGGRSPDERQISILMSFTWTLYNFFSLTHMISNITRDVQRIAPAHPMIRKIRAWTQLDTDRSIASKLRLGEQAALSIVDCLSITLPSVASCVLLLESID